jgi:hypothetical protein
VIFHDVTISIGSVYSRRTHDSAALVPGAVEFFRSILDRSGPNFREPLPDRQLAHIELQWTRQGTAAAATFWSRGAPVTTSALAPGLDAGDDETALRAIQELLVLRFHGDSATEPGFDLLTIAERPLLATVPIPVPSAGSIDLALIADMETCLAAAFFWRCSDHAPASR